MAASKHDQAFATGTQAHQDELRRRTGAQVPVVADGPVVKVHPLEEKSKQKVLIHAYNTFKSEQLLIKSVGQASNTELG